MMEKNFQDRDMTLQKLKNTELIKESDRLRDFEMYINVQDMGKEQVKECEDVRN